MNVRIVQRYAKQTEDAKLGWPRDLRPVPATADAGSGRTRSAGSVRRIRTR